MDLSHLRCDTITAWIPFDGDTEVLLSYISRDELRKIRKEATAFRFTDHRMVEETDAGEAERRLGRRAVKDWRALPGRPGFTMNGAPFPYSPESCDLLMERFNEFALFVNDKALRLAAFVEGERSEVLKNFSATSGQG